MRRLAGNLQRRTVIRLAAWYPAWLLAAAWPGAARAADPTTAQPVPDRFIGNWSGPWRLGMNSGRVTLAIAADPQRPGTIAATNIPKFGMSPAEIYRIVVDGDAISFRADGADNSVMRVALSLKQPGGELEGTITHDGFANHCRLQRNR